MDTWTRLVAPKSKNPDHARSEQLFNALLVGGLLLMFPAMLAVVIRALVNPVGVAVAIVGGIAYASLFLLFGLSRSGRWRLACQLAVTMLLGIGAYAFVIAGIKGSGALYLLLAATLTSVLLGGPAGVGVMLIGIAIYFGLGLAVERGRIFPVLEPSVAVDGTTFAAVGLIITNILWFATRELSRALIRARQQADELKKADDEKSLMLSELMTVTEEQAQVLGLVEELTLPVTRLYHGVLLLPVVGALDTHRMARLNQELLQAVAIQRAKVAILDLTGVPHLDVAVAERLAQTVQAVRFMGCQLMLVGIHPRLARVLVNLELEKTGVATYADLQGGLEHALWAVRRRIVEVAAGSPTQAEVSDV
jgi:anti-anti-sigma factor